jgi:myo-inositol-1(or 4)-monophosphatase
VRFDGSRRALQPLRELAELAVLSAGRSLRERSNLKVLSSKGKDIKLAADRQAEDTVVGILRRNSDLSILSEETGEIGAIHTPDQPLWVVDPIDGSYNYKRGIPACCVSVALWAKRTPLLGVIYDFTREELFAAVVNEGAWLNRDRIRVANARRRREAVLFTGLPVGSKYTARGFGRLAREMGAYKKVRMIGSAALSLAYVACGRGDAYHEDGIMLWDVAAGLALLRAAGGRFVLKPYGRRRHCLSVTGAA